MKLKFEHRIALAYLLLGALWILFSDKILNFLIIDSATVASVQLYKGWFYVLITALLFFFFIKRHLYRLRQSEKNLFDKNLELETAKLELIVKNQELKKATKKAEESSNLKTAFLNNISHEFRTPMNSILGFTEMLTHSDITNEQKRSYALWVEKSSKQLLDIVTDIIEISQVQQGQVVTHKEKCDLEKIIEHATEKAKKKIGNKKITLDAHLDLDSPQIYSDCHKLNRSLDHLLDNAVKFTPDGKIDLSCTLKNNELKITIIDSGIGIPSEIQDIIFDPFRQAEIGSMRNYGGSGLGLTLVKSYIDILGGTISLESNPGKGSTITLILPVTPVMSKTDIFEQAPNMNVLKGKHILIVEDEEVNYLYLHEVLKDHEMIINYANNGLEAINICKNKPELDLVLMDLKMPTMNGYDATKAIRNFRKDIPIIAQSAYDLAIAPETADKTLFSDFISKPIREDDLLKIINKHVS